ncbi:hypothetical protein ACT9XH_01350 [Methanococcoides methylutens]|uniref:hypothetical protein n=1 Tax=Methanococcoides methylutens TaxID=2226 RepID=UPI00404508DE
MNSANITNPEDIPLEPWANLGFEHPDSEIVEIYQLEQHLGTLPQVAEDIRNLITRLEICHFKFERHILRIIGSIGSMKLNLYPDSIGSAHPKCGENAWQADKTGRSRKGQEYIWALQTWLSGEQLPEGDTRGIPGKLFEEIYSSLGQRDKHKELLVSALLDRLLWNFETERSTLIEQFETLIYQIDRTDICHYAFPENIKKTIEAIGELSPSTDFEGCGSSDEEHQKISLKSFTNLAAWLQGEINETGRPLGERTLLKRWLVACLAKTIKELAGLEKSMPELTDPEDLPN